MTQVLCIVYTVWFCSCQIFSLKTKTSVCFGLWTAAASLENFGAALRRTALSVDDSVIEPMDSFLNVSSLHTADVYSKTNK